ncbi:hypothetical protein DUNSADRAFT_15297 [Dunaliella salina]|uniref:SnoaL-like domain-containing protein n=1 Tax=Dunaliella salina TaxID=3046 RepID=A0ABQ7G5Q8_DUNSA|nr:hypothetical protein DUNSADRAFT_15297 [Dunaliella salina]|eukprot:KAF5829941.1 hypothetical protein DUNSADRAFT_15297 [Dunaliella salina]
MISGTHPTQLSARSHAAPLKLHSTVWRQPTRPSFRARPCIHAAAKFDADVGPQNLHQACSRRAQLLGFLGVGITAAALPLAGPMPAVAQETPQMGDLANKIAIDFVKNQYYVTGNINADLYTDDCTFKDPTTTVRGPQKYADALKTLFDPSRSKAELISIKVDEPHVYLRWRLEGTLNFAGLSIKPYTGTTTYTVDESSGKIKEHSEVWDISTLDAFISPFFPNFGAPPAPPAEKLRADLIRNSFQAAGKPVPAGLRV